ncbi:hypothetical protein G5714_006001 [Onychostoma macrolepis]|uniref:Uncharacterized protein n=1 Tax=Onychostoma macrolepis TaxID=369639 RepID=A0A7J6D2M1_9TELE|nr:hypothetical protein G5714_006001 [Onychostoma macrolepis]
MSLKECCACEGPVELPDAHDACVFCLGRAHAEAALDGPDCPSCEEMLVKTLRARISVILNCAPTNPLPPPPVLCQLQPLVQVTGPPARSQRLHTARSSSLQRPKRRERPPPTPSHTRARVDPEPAVRPKARQFRYPKKMGPCPSSAGPDPQQRS